MPDRYYIKDRLGGRVYEPTMARYPGDVAAWIKDKCSGVLADRRLVRDQKEPKFGAWETVARWERGEEGRKKKRQQAVALCETLNWFDPDTPYGIISDYLEEQGRDTEAKWVRDYEAWRNFIACNKVKLLGGPNNGEVHELPNGPIGMNFCMNQWSGETENGIMHTTIKLVTYNWTKEIEGDVIAAEWQPPRKHFVMEAS